MNWTWSPPIGFALIKGMSMEIIGVAGGRLKSPLSLRSIFKFEIDSLAILYYLKSALIHKTYVLIS